MTASASRRLRRQDGFTMALVMGVMLIATTLGLAAFAAARGGIHGSGVSKDRKQAYAAAEAGLNWYQSRLAADNSYWAKCTSVPAIASGVPAPVNQAGASAPIWRRIPGSTAEYKIDLLPAPGQPSCNASNPDASMIDSLGTFRIRATGRFNGETRAIVARFRRARFLDFLWFTDYETTDPLAYSSGYAYGSVRYVDYANAYCADKYRVDRDRAYRDLCLEIQFASYDALKGPLHSNDSLLICGSTTFGRGAADKIESSANENTSATGSPSPGWRPACNGTSPNFVGPFKYAQPTMTMPATNSNLSSYAQSNYTFTGTTTIVLNAGGTMNVTNAAKGWSNKSMPWPSNGLVYVGSGSCGSTQPPVSQTYGEPAGCANVYVKGTYSQDLTIASAKDVVVYGDLLRDGDALMGLIADNFVRVYHPTAVSSTDNTCDRNKSTTTWGSYLPTVTIQAAIMSLQHSFTVDNYDCGAGLGDLSIVGAIAQKYRGAVAQGGTGTTPTHGYSKDYTYDDRLRYRNPPYFLTPVNAAWRLLRTNEQVPAR